jgi:DNA-3-methyladenine glycosylase I
MNAKPLTRCPWPKTDLDIAYHDREWGVPQHDDRTLFEFLILEGAQAGLSWSTILKKRDNYRKAFDNFDPAKVARYDNKKISSLLADPGIVRNRLKIASTLTNASAFLAVQREHGSFDRYLWAFTDGKPVINRWKRFDQVPAATPLSDAISKDLRKRGFRFVGTTIIYAYLQAVGVVNDHLTTCYRHAELH